MGIKYGTSYETLAKKITPYLSQKTPAASKYPSWWDTTITLYNKYEDDDTNEITWFKHILHGCFFKQVSSTTRAEHDITHTENAIVRIPESDKFIECGVWITLTSEERENSFTLCQGDVIIIGEVDETPDEYTEGSQMSDILAKYKKIGSCFVIDKFNINTGISRGLPHYYASGM